jgi:3D (Asp-Asp-Asp) domain-containing protein
MARKTKKKNLERWAYFAVAAFVVLILAEGRFYIPKYIRPPQEAKVTVVEMKTTSYCHCRRCCSYKWFLFIPYQKTGFASFRFKQVGITSSGTMARPGTIAADTSIYPYGTVMYIPGYGYGRVEDTGGAVKGRHIDLYRPNHWFARHWGVQTKKVKVWLPAEGRPWSFNPADANTNDSSSLPPVTVSETNLVPSSVSPEQIPLP